MAEKDSKVRKIEVWEGVRQDTNISDIMKTVGKRFSGEDTLLVFHQLMMLENYWVRRYNELVDAVNKL